MTQPNTPAQMAAGAFFDQVHGYGATAEKAAPSLPEWTESLAPDASALARFIHNNEPASPTDSAEFRAGLAEVLAEAQQAAQPVAGEPVATVIDWTNGSYHRNYRLKWHRDVPEGTGLYTAAPAPVGLVPLTDEQIHNPYQFSGGAAKIWLNGFRAAERAHGIKAGKDGAK